MTGTKSIVNIIWTLSLEAVARRLTPVKTHTETKQSIKIKYIFSCAVENDTNCVNVKKLRFTETQIESNDNCQQQCHFFSLTSSVFLFGLSDSEKFDGDSDKQNLFNKTRNIFL